MSDEPQPKARETSRIRTVFAVIFGIIAVVGLFASTVAVWANGILFDSDKVASAAEKAIQQPEAAASVSTYVADQLFTIVDLNALLQEQLPDKLDPLSGVIVGGAREFVEGQLAELLQKPGVQAVLVGIVRTGHAQLMNVLNGDGLFDGVSVSDGKVTLNMLPIVALGFAQIQKLGLLTDVTLPDLSAAGDPTKQIGALEATFGRDLPDGFGQLTVFEGDAVAEASEVVQQAQQVVVLVKRAIVVILVITVVAFVASILLANRRRRAILVLGLASAAVMLIARTAIKQALARTPNLVINPGARQALASALEDLASGLVTVVTLLVVLGLIAAAVMMLTGTGPMAQRLRTRAGSAGGSAGSVLVANRELSATVAFGLAVLTIVMFGLTLLPILAALVLAAGGVVLLAGRREAGTA